MPYIIANLTGRCVDSPVRTWIRDINTIASGAFDGHRICSRRIRSIARNCRSINNHCIIGGIGAIEVDNFNIGDFWAIASRRCSRCLGEI